MDRYIGLDAHASSCTVAVLGPSGRKLQCQVLETNAKALISFLETIPKNRRLIFEEGTHSNWLHEVLAPHVQETVVVAVRQSRGPKDDERDAFGLAEDLRIGKIRTAQIMPIVVTPYRFANKHQFWAYCGLGIVMRSSSDWVRAQNGEWIKASIQKTRGLNRNFNRSLKHVFKGAATTIICRANKDDPLCQHYQALLDGGTKPNLAKLTISRQIASIVLSVWRSQEVYDPKKLSPKT